MEYLNPPENTGRNRRRDRMRAIIARSKLAYDRFMEKVVQGQPDLLGAVFDGPAPEASHPADQGAVTPQPLEMAHGIVDDLKWLRANNVSADDIIARMDSRTNRDL